MQINAALNLVIPLYREDEIYAYVHAAPISRAVFELNYKLLNRTFSGIVTEGITGSRVSYLILKEAAGELAGGRRDPETISAPLLNELRRLSNVLLPGANGFDVSPLQDALDTGRLDEDDVPEVLSAIVFFTAAWHGHPKQARMEFLEAGARMWSASITSLNITAFAASLKTSTETANTGASPVPVSSVPY